MQSTILKNLGLNKNEITVYLVLLREGKQKAREIMSRTSLTRGLTYKALQDLEDKQIIIREDEENTVSEFSAIHPNVLQGLVEQKSKKVEELKQNLSSELGAFTSLYNLGNNKPGIEFYEGLAGIQKMYAEILNSVPTTKTILSFVKVMDQKISKDGSKMLSSYIAERISRGIKTNVLAVDDTFGRTLQKKDSLSLRETKLLAHKKFPLEFPGGELIMTENKLYFMSFENDTRIAIAISSKSMLQMMSFIFHSLWSTL